MATTLAPPTDDATPPAREATWTARGPAAERARRTLRGRPDDPAWVRPALLALLAATAVVYLWGLGASGWANAYYSAAVQAGAKSWKAFLYGSFDASNFITVDKSPAFLWPMDLSARLFGVSAWSILVPQALEGVAAVGVLYAAVRRWSTPAAGLLAGATLALTPVATLMFRYDNPDALLVLLLTAAAYATVRAIEDGRTRWVVLVGTLVGFAFLAKMLQALLVVPGFGVAYLVAAPGTVWRRARQLLVAAGALLVSAGWWLALVALTPASARPYVGGSQNDSIWNLLFGYNGFGRLTGNERGSVGGGPPGGGGQWGPTGWTRLFNAQFGGQASWLLPAALLAAVVLLALTWRARRDDRLRAATIVWGGWLLVTGAAISFGQGIIHPYYTVALAPAIGALVGLGATELWRRREHPAARFALVAGIVLSGWWAWRLLDRTPSWHPELRTFVLLGAIAAAALVAGFPALTGRRAAAVVALGLAVVLVGPAAYSWATVTTPHSGALPSAGPAGAGGAGPRGRGGRGGPGRFGPGAVAGGLPGTPRAFAGGAGGGLGGLPGGAGGLPPLAGRKGAAGGPPGGGVGGILGASTPSAALTATLRADAGRYRWVAAAVSANQAAGYQLATGDPVMAIGGFNGTDPAPTLAEFQAYVRAGEVHWFVGSGGGRGGPGGFGPAGAARGAGAEITSWVQANFTASTVGGVTLYDLTAPTTAASATVA